MIWTLSFEPIVTVAGIVNTVPMLYYLLKTAWPDFEGKKKLRLTLLFVIS